VRSLCQARELHVSNVTTLDFNAASVCIMRVSLRVNGIDHDTHLHLMHPTESSCDPVIESNEGVWRLIHWGPDTFLGNNSPRAD
jgi:hypothetical protein